MAEAARRTILLVEDEAIIAMAEAGMLKKNGYAVCLAYSGSTAVETVERDEAIDLVLMDLDLGSGMDGAEAAERILSEKNLPVLFLSSHTEPEVVERTERIASYGYVVKNSGDKVLLASIKMAFKLFEARVKYQAKAAELESANAKLEAANARLERALAERDKIEKALGASEAELRSLFDAVPACIGMLEDRVFRKVNAVMLKTFGYSEEEMLGRTTRMLYCDDAEYERVGRDLYEALRGERNSTIETRLRRKDGTVLDILVGASPMDPAPSGPKSRIASVLFDLTEKRRAQDSLRAKERLLAELFRACPESVALSSLDDGRFIEVNEATSRVFGYPREEVIGRSVEELGLWCDPSERAYVVDRLKREGSLRDFEAKLRRKDGAVIDALMSMMRIEVEGRPCLLGFVTDISGRKRTEAELGESLLEKETLLHELQHRIKNGLAMIASIIDLEADRSDGEEMVRVLDNLKGRIDSMSALYDLFSKSDFSGCVDLRDYLNATVDSLVEACSGGDGRIRAERLIEAIRINVKDALSWGLIVNELVTNAFKYAFRPGDRGSIRVKLSKSEDWIELVVSDDGAGLPEGFDLEHSGGLGLDIVRMMAAQLKGRLEIDRSRGTAFIVRVPREA